MCLFFFFKQKTAYEMRISDWSSDVCSSDLLKDELILAYSTASSETVLPRIMEKMTNYGAPQSITSFVIPTGYSFNLDGSTLYQSIAALFLAQLYGRSEEHTSELQSLMRSPYAVLCLKKNNQ